MRSYPTPVIPDYKQKSSGGTNTTVTEYEKACWQAKLRTLLEEEQEKERSESSSDDSGSDPDANAPKDPSKRMIASILQLRAVDSALVNGIGSGLKAFLAGHRIRPLAPGERRYFIDANIVPGAEPPEPEMPTDLIRQRACVCGNQEGDERLETMSFKATRILCQTPDQGPVGWPALFWLYCHIGLNGWFNPDPHHRTWNDVRLALKHAGVNLVFLETTVCANLPSGPFDGAAWFNEMCAAAAEYVAKAGPEDGLFTMLYESIVLDQDGAS